MLPTRACRICSSLISEHGKPASLHTRPTVALSFWVAHVMDRAGDQTDEPVLLHVVDHNILPSLDPCPLHPFSVCWRKGGRRPAHVDALHSFLPCSPSCLTSFSPNRYSSPERYSSPPFPANSVPSGPRSEWLIFSQTGINLCIGSRCFECRKENNFFIFKPFFFSLPDVGENEDAAFIRRGIGNRKHASYVVSENSSIKNQWLWVLRQTSTIGSPCCAAFSSLSPCGEAFWATQSVKMLLSIAYSTRGEWWSAPLHRLFRMGESDYPDDNLWFFLYLLASYVVSVNSSIKNNVFVFKPFFFSLPDVGKNGDVAFIRTGIGNRKHTSYVVSINSSIKNQSQNFRTRNVGLWVFWLERIERVWCVIDRFGGDWVGGTLALWCLTWFAELRVFGCIVCIPHLEVCCFWQEIDMIFYVYITIISGRNKYQKISKSRQMCWSSQGIHGILLDTPYYTWLWL